MQLHYAVFLFAHQSKVLTAYLSITGETVPDRQPFPHLWRKADTPGNEPPHSAWFSWYCTEEDWASFIDAIPSGISTNPNTSFYTEENWTRGEVLDDTNRKDVQHRVDERLL